MISTRLVNRYFTLRKRSKEQVPQAKPRATKKQKRRPRHSYYLANAYHANNRLDEAIEAYEQFKLVLDPLVYDAALVNEQINACRIASEQQKNPMYFISVNLGEGINDRFEETKPVVSGDESALAFTRKLQFYEAVFYCRRENGKWSEPVNLTPAFGLDGNSYTTGLSYNGDEIFVYRSDNFDGNLYSSKYKSGKWSKLEKLNGNINTKYWESHATLSRDGKTLYFTSNREGGYGGLDIYRSERTRSGDWGPVVNLGPVINSKYNEDTPFITEDGNTLYFSSMGHYNMGGYDIFYSTRLQGGQWAKPVNAGYPLNTTRDDLFFVPVRDGAYAYYSKYDPQDSYGMADLYKLEVFTGLHPRKFILNGITNVDGKASPSYSQFTATLIHPGTRKVIDQTRLNPDGSYTLNALSGEFDLQISGDGINDNIEKITIPIDNPSNIVAHSSLLTASAATVAIAEAVPVIMEEAAPGPELVIPVDSYNVTTGDAVPIRLNLERNTKLNVATMLDGKLTKNEIFEIRRSRFVYMLTPEPGVNTLRFSLINNKGDSTVREVTVTYTPDEEELSAPAPTKLTVLSDSDRFLGMASLTGDKLEAYLKSLDIRKMDFKSVTHLYDNLLENAETHAYTIQDVHDMFTKFMAQKDLNLFYDELKDQASDSIAKILDNTDLRVMNIYTSHSLLDFLYHKADSSSFNINELRNALFTITSLKRDPRELIILLESFSADELAAYLGKMKQTWQSYPDSRAVADDILKAVENNEFPISQLDSMLKLAAADLNVHFLSQSLIFISSDNLKQTLLDTDLENQGIRNSQDIISYLFKTADKRNYTKHELLENIDKVRRDPYYFVDLFRKILAEKAAGSLKEFLQEIDIRNLKINTYEQLVDYLLNQSQFHDYNREMVYQLLIDIIDPQTVREFINLLKKYADNRILQAIDATDNNQFSKPLEVMQYLLSVAPEYNYTERDLLRVLLKMVLSKGPDAGSEKRQGWLANIDRPALVTSLVIINAIIILLLILFLFRKKRKNE